MAITRRQFVTRLGALAAAAGFSQVEASKIMDAVAYPAGSTGISGVYQGTFGKPRVVWLHGAECTGCSTSLLGIFENLSGIAVEGTTITTAAALGIAGTIPINNPVNNTSVPTLAHISQSPDPAGTVDIADVVIDVIDLLYHETVMGMGGDLAYQWLTDFSINNHKPFVLVVEGALQNTADTGAWNDTSSSTVPWCSVAHQDAPSAAGVGEVVTADMVKTLGESPFCVGIIAIGQCATFGGYPACHPPISSGVAGFNSNESQTDAMGTKAYLVAHGSDAAAKVINAPGCPTNPWWFILTVVAFTVDLPTVFVPAGPATNTGLGILPNQATPGTVGPLGVLKTLPGGQPTALLAQVGINPGGVDGSGRLKAVYSDTVHSAYCTRFRYYAKGIFAQHPGDHGCLQKVGCKGPASHSLCSTHGWNNQQPQNRSVVDTSASNVLPAINPAEGGPAYPYQGGNCTRAGHPCMACTEKGYPDAFVPFVVRL